MAALALLLVGCGDPLGNLCEYETRNAYIINGQRADNPSAVRIRNEKFLCSASIVGPHTVLTAAHCRDMTYVDYFAGAASYFIVGQVEHPKANEPGAHDLRILYVQERFPEESIQALGPIECTTLVAQGYGIGSVGGLNERVVEESYRGNGIIIGSESICNGDSGGPLLAVAPDGTTSQVGVNSFGTNEAYVCTGDSTGFVDLTQDGNLEWVQENIR